MAVSGLVFDELMSRIARTGMGGVDESRTEPIIDRNNGQWNGLLVETSLERVAVFCRELESLALADVSQVRHTMIHAQARRALLYVPGKTTISNPVMLLATLSKIQIVRLAEEDPARLSLKESSSSAA